MRGTRRLIVVADDFGIGPATSRGILDVADDGAITGAVLLVNSPYTEKGVRDWRRRGARLPLGWHPCLTLDCPLLPAEQVPSLVGADGRFHPLAAFLARVALGRIQSGEVRAELEAQHRRFIEIVGHPPGFVNGHQHVHLFPPVGAALCDVLRQQADRPMLRRVRETLGMLWHVPGARLKRTFLSLMGWAAGRRREQADFPGAAWLAGITDPRWLQDPAYFPRWLASTPGDEVELMVHPGHWDETLIGRDCASEDFLRRRVDELKLLRAPAFREACRTAGFTLVAPASATGRGGKDAAA